MTKLLFSRFGFVHFGKIVKEFQGFFDLFPDNYTQESKETDVRRRTSVSFDPDQERFFLLR